MDIFTTGAHLRPLKTRDYEGKDLYVWVVTGFEENSFRDGEIFNPPESAYDLDVLTKEALPDED